MTVACLLAGLAIAGCGGGGPLSNGQLRSDAAAICSTASHRLDRIPTPTSPAGGAAFVSEGIRIVETEQRQLSHLRADDGRYQRAVDELALKIRPMRSAARGLHGGDDPVVAIKTLQSHLAPIERRADGEWRELGIPSCEDR